MATTKSDWFHDMLKKVDHDRWTILLPAAVVGLVLLMFLPYFGCSFKTDSLRDPGKKVTLVQLQSEIQKSTLELDTEWASIQKQVQTYNAKKAALAEQGKLRQADLIAKQEQAQVMLETVGNLIQAYAPPPIGSVAAIGIGLLGTALFAGKKLDTSRKDQIINELKSPEKPAA